MARQCISVVMCSEINIPKHCNPLERWFLGRKIFLNLEPFFSGHSMAISAEVIPKCGLVGESPKKRPYFTFRNYSDLSRFSFWGEMRSNLIDANLDFHLGIS